MENKICSKCGIEKNISEFRKRKDNRIGPEYYYYVSYCKDCEKATTKKYKEKYYETHKEIVKEKSRLQRENNHEEYLNYMNNYYNNNKEILLQKNKEYVEKHKEKTKKYQKDYSDSHKETKKEYDKEYFEKNKEKIIKRMYEKYMTDEIYRFKQQIRNEIKASFRRKGFIKKDHTYEIIGTDFERFYGHLLNTYEKNYGEKWDGVEMVHIDHIIPLATAKTEEEIIKLCHYTNLQLLKAKDNLEKGDKLDWKLEELS